MGKRFKVFLLFLLAAFVIIQVIPSKLPENKPVEGYNFFESYNVPVEVERIIRNSCFDCHSQEVRYPWYAYVAPSSWLVGRDIRMGRGNLDFSGWSGLGKKEKLQLAGEIADEVEEGKMPMEIYVFMHPDAAISEEDRELILQWTEELAEKIFEE